MTPKSKFSQSLGQSPNRGSRRLPSQVTT